MKKSVEELIGAAAMAMNADLKRNFQREAILFPAVLTIIGIVFTYGQPLILGLVVISLFLVVNSFFAMRRISPAILKNHIVLVSMAAILLFFTSFGYIFIKYQHLDRKLILFIEIATIVVCIALIWTALGKVGSLNRLRVYYENEPSKESVEDLNKMISGESAEFVTLYSDSIFKHIYKVNIIDDYVCIFRNDKKLIEFFPISDFHINPTGPDFEGRVPVTFKTDKDGMVEGHIEKSDIKKIALIVSHNQEEYDDEEDDFAGEQAVGI